MTARRPKTEAKFRDDQLAIELDGPGVSPSNVDTLRALAVASAFLEHLHQIAAQQGVELSFAGLEIQDKCAAVVCRTSSPQRAKQAAGEALRHFSAPDAVTGPLATSV